MATKITHKVDDSPPYLGLLCKGGPSRMVPKLRELNCEPIFEQILPPGVQERRKKLGGSYAPHRQVLKGQKYAGSDRVNITKVRDIIFFIYRSNWPKQPK